MDFAATGSRRHIAFEHIFIDGQAPTAVVETHSLSAIRTILAESDMMTVLSRFEAIGEQKTGPLTVLNFRVPGPGRVVGFIKNKDWTPNATQAAFMEALRRAARQLSAVDAG